MRNVLAVVLGVGMALLSGCVFAEKAAGIRRDAEGHVISVDDEPVNTIGNILRLILPPGIGAAAGAAVTLGVKVYRHNAIVSSGGRDDDFDGRPDPPSKPETPSA